MDDRGLLTKQPTHQHQLLLKLQTSTTRDQLPPPPPSLSLSLLLCAALSLLSASLYSKHQAPSSQSFSEQTADPPLYPIYTIDRWFGPQTEPTDSSKWTAAVLLLYQQIGRPTSTSTLPTKPNRWRLKAHEVRSSWRCCTSHQIYDLPYEYSSIIRSIPVLTILIFTKVEARSIEWATSHHSTTTCYSTSIKYKQHYHVNIYALLEEKDCASYQVPGTRYHWYDIMWYVRIRCGPSCSARIRQPPMPAL